MIKDILLGQYFPGNSILHRLDPRTKIICLMLFITGVFVAKSYLAYAILTGVTFLLITLSAVPLRLVVKSLKPLWVIMLITLLIHLLTTPGNVVYSIGVVVITREGIEQGVTMTARLVLLIAMSSLLTFTTSPISLTDGVESLLRPFKRLGVPAHEMAMMMTIALRFIPILLEETERIMKAQMSRGADFSHGNLVRRAKNLIPLLVPLFISAFRRADELATAMEARCYQGGDNRTRMKILRVSTGDWIALLAAAGLIVMLAVLRFSGH